MTDLAGKWVLRPARVADQGAITSIVRAARINPMGLDWRRFMVADAAGRIIGVGQIKPHHDGCRELASIAVVPDRRGEGIASRLIQALLASEPPGGPLYLICRPPLEAFYTRFAFHRIQASEMPPHFRRIARLMAVMERMLAFFGRAGPLGAIMRVDR
jgi:amino-acid N-acetyltransferase